MTLTTHRFCWALTILCVEQEYLPAAFTIFSPVKVPSMITPPLIKTEMLFLIKCEMSKG